MRRLAVAFVLVAVSLPVAPAAADDQSLRDAGRSADAQFERLGKQTRRALRAWERAGHDRRGASRVIRLHRRTRREIDIVGTAVRAESPSSEGGATYKRLLLRSLRFFDGAMRLRIRSVRLWMRGRHAAARAAWRRSNRRLDRSGRLTERAIRAIEA